MQSGRNMAGLLLAMIFTISNLTPAYAHQPINLTAANSSPNKGPIIVDGKVSFVIRANFTKPNQIFYAKNNNIPIILLNGRISKKSFSRWKLFNCIL